MGAVSPVNWANISRLTIGIASVVCGAKLNWIESETVGLEAIEASLHSEKALALAYRHTAVFVGTNEKNGRSKSLFYIDWF